MDPHQSNYGAPRIELLNGCDFMAIMGLHHVCRNIEHHGSNMEVHQYIIDVHNPIQVWSNINRFGELLNLVSSIIRLIEIQNYELCSSIIDIDLWASKI